MHSTCRWSDFVWILWFFKFLHTPVSNNRPTMEFCGGSVRKFVNYGGSGPGIPKFGREFLKSRIQYWEFPVHHWHVYQVPMCLCVCVHYAVVYFISLAIILLFRCAIYMTRLARRHSEALKRTYTVLWMGFIGNMLSKQWELSWWSKLKNTTRFMMWTMMKLHRCAKYVSLFLNIMKGNEAPL